MVERMQKPASARQACEEVIARGRMVVNGHLANLEMKADPQKDKITVIEKLVELEEELVYIAIHKPSNVISAASPQDNLMGI